MGYNLILKKTPSRLSSIILLALINILITSTLIGLHRDSHVDKNSRTDLWDQPIDLNDKYPTLISKHTWDIEFTEIEKVIGGLEFNSNQEIIINTYTLDKLKLVISHLNTNLLNVEWDRLALLIKKSLGNNNGDIFYSLAKSYYSYKKDRDYYLMSIKNAKPTEKLSLLKNSSKELIKIQSEHFGIKNASSLFKKQNITTNYLNSRKIIHKDSKLSDIEKTKKLSLLSQDYKKSISQW